MQRLLVYIRNRYQTSELSRIQICIVSKDALDLFIHPSPFAHFHTPSIFFPMKIQRGSPVDLT